METNFCFTGPLSRINLRHKYSCFYPNGADIDGTRGGCMKGHTFCTYKKRIFFSGTETE